MLNWEHWWDECGDFIIRMGTFGRNWVSGQWLYQIWTTHSVSVCSPNPASNFFSSPFTNVSAWDWEIIRGVALTNRTRLTVHRCQKAIYLCCRLLLLQSFMF